MPNFDNPAHRTTEQRLNRSAPYRQDDDMDHLIKMRVEQPDAFAKLPARVHIAVGLYEGDRAANEAITGGAA